MQAGTALTPFSCGYEVGAGKAAATLMLLDAIIKSHKAGEPLQALIPFLASIRYIRAIYVPSSSTEELVHRRFATKIRSSIRQRPNILQLGCGFQRAAECILAAGRSGKGVKEVIQETIATYNQSVGVKGNKISTEERLAIRCVFSADPQFRAELEKHFHAHKCAKSALTPAVLGMDCYSVGFVPTLPHSEPTWISACTTTSKSAVLWAQKLTNTFEANLLAISARGQSVNTNRALARHLN